MRDGGGGVSYLSEVELERVVGRERHAEATCVVVVEGVAVVVEEERVVTEWTHRDSDSSQVVQILQHWCLQQTCT